MASLPPIHILIPLHETIPYLLPDIWSLAMAFTPSPFFLSLTFFFFFRGKNFGQLIFLCGNKGKIMHPIRRWWIAQGRERSCFWYYKLPSTSTDIRVPSPFHRQTYLRFWHRLFEPICVSQAYHKDLICVTTLNDNAIWTKLTQLMLNQSTILY